MTHLRPPLSEVTEEAKAGQLAVQANVLPGTGSQKTWVAGERKRR